VGSFIAILQDGDAAVGTMMNLRKKDVSNSATALHFSSGKQTHLKSKQVFISIDTKRVFENFSMFCKLRIESAIGHQWLPPVILAIQEAEIRTRG
jgi:hypothetical protein